MRARARMLSAEAISTQIFSSSVSFKERQTRCETLRMPLGEKIQDCLESSMRVVLYSETHFLQFLMIRTNAYFPRKYCIVPSHPNFGYESLIVRQRGTIGSEGPKALRLGQGRGHKS